MRRNLELLLPLAMLSIWHADCYLSDVPFLVSQRGVHDPKDLRAGTDITNTGAGVFWLLAALGWSGRTGFRQTFRLTEEQVILTWLLAAALKCFKTTTGHHR